MSSQGLKRSVTVSRRQALTGRRVEDDVVSVSLRAIAGLTLALADKKFTPDAAAAPVTDGLAAEDVKAGFLKSFPFLGIPLDGSNNPDK